MATKAKKTNSSKYSSHYMITNQAGMMAFHDLLGDIVEDRGNAFQTAYLSDLVTSKRRRKHILANGISTRVYKKLYTVILKGFKAYLKCQHPIFKPNEYVMIDGFYTQIIPIPKKHDVELFGQGAVMIIEKSDR